MIKAKTVFVVGAGASCELNFPSGAKLLSDIAKTLDIRFSGWERQSGDGRIFAAYEELAKHPDGRRGDANRYLHAGWRIRDAAHLALSIDNVINQLDDDPLGLGQKGRTAKAATGEAAPKRGRGRPRTQQP